jgi:hypothetical protein
MIVGQSSDLFVWLGNEQFNSLASAIEKESPPSLPAELDAIGVLVGRVIIEKNATTLINVATPFTTQFNLSQVTQHNHLSGLNDGDYIHLTTLEYSDFQSIPNTYLPLSGGTLTGPLSGTSILALDNIGIGPSSDPSIRFDVIAEGASSDIEIRLRNSGNTANLFEVSGDGSAKFPTDGRNIYFGTGSRITTAASNALLVSFSLFNCRLENIFNANANDMYGIGRLNIGGAYDTNGTNFVHIANGTAPTSSGIDRFKIYSKDIAPGIAAPHFLLENLDEIRLYKYSAVTTSQSIADALTSMGLLSASTIDNPYLSLSGGTLTGGLSATTISATTLWSYNDPWTIELIDATSVDFYAPYAMVINSYTNILGSPSINLMDDDVAYTTGTTIAIGSKISVSGSTTGVTILNAVRL